MVNGLWGNELVKMDSGEIDYGDWFVDFQNCKFFILCGYHNKFN